MLLSPRFVLRGEKYPRVRRSPYTGRVCVCVSSHLARVFGSHTLNILTASHLCWEVYYLIPRSRANEPRINPRMRDCIYKSVCVCVFRILFFLPKRLFWEVAKNWTFFLLNFNSPWEFHDKKNKKKVFFFTEKFSIDEYLLKFHVCHCVLLWKLEKRSK